MINKISGRQEEHLRHLRLVISNLLLLFTRFVNKFCHIIVELNVLKAMNKNSGFPSTQSHPQLGQFSCNAREATMILRVGIIGEIKVNLQI